MGRAISLTDSSSEKKHFCFPFPFLLPPNYFQSTFLEIHNKSAFPPCDFVQNLDKSFFSWRSLKYVYAARNKLTFKKSLSVLGMAGGVASALGSWNDFISVYLR